jgi:hypothetical protein
MGGHAELVLARFVRVLESLHINHPLFDISLFIALSFFLLLLITRCTYPSLVTCTNVLHTHQPIINSCSTHVSGLHFGHHTLFLLSLAVAVKVAYHGLGT